MSRQEDIDEEERLRRHVSEKLSFPVRGSPSFSKGVSPSALSIRGSTTQITVTSASLLVLPADPHRKFLFIQNNDALGVVHVSFGVDATLATGMQFSASGGGILLDFNCPTAAVYAIGSIASNSNVTVITA